VGKQGIERDVMWAQIERIVSLTLCAVHPRLSLSYRACLSEHELQSHDTSKCFQVGSICHLHVCHSVAHNQKTCPDYLYCT